MRKIFRTNNNRKSYQFTKKSVKVGDLSDVPANDLAPTPYKEHIEKDLHKIQKDFRKKIRKCKELELNAENSTMFDTEIENAKARPLSILQSQMGIHRRMISEIVLNTEKSNEINVKSLEEKLNQQTKVQTALEDAIRRLTIRERVLNPKTQLAFEGESEGEQYE